jgi:hypothetical protein
MLTVLKSTTLTMLPLVQLMTLSSSKRGGMIVRCISTGGKSLLAVDIARGNTPSSVFHVTLARDYIVYGVSFHHSVMTYLIQDDTGFPQWTPASLFQVVCGRVSRHWVLADWSDTEYIAAMTFVDFVRSPEEFDRLSEGDNVSREVFYERKSSADLEFVDYSVTSFAEALDEKWVQCPLCSDAWETQSEDAMTRCPNCRSILRNRRA